MEYIIILFLVCCSAVFSGLTIGYFSLNTTSLRRRAKLGDIQASTILPLRLQGNKLLTTLLLGNVTVNTMLAVYLGDLVSGVIANIAATSLIFLFGEIIPQATIARHALWFGSLCAPLVRVLMIALSPITYPVSTLLNRLLGEEMPTVYSRHEVIEIVSELEDSSESTIDADEERIVHGALRFSHTAVHEVMTPLENVTMFSVTQRLDHDFFALLAKENYSRYPVYSEVRTNVTGILYTKALLHENENVSILEAAEAYETELLELHPNTLLDTALSVMLKKRQHLAVVRGADRRALGILSLEDIIEEIIQVEIEDEDDH